MILRVILKPSSIALLFSAVDSLRAGRNVLIIAEPRSTAFGIARLLIAVAKRLGIPLANHRGVSPTAPWVYARGHNDPIELIAKDADVYRDVTARFERSVCPPPRMRSVEG
jgi:chromosome condensin MukBEF complex kleisin-like MukF subunit